MSDAAADDAPVRNDSFSKVITWRVFNERIFPTRVVSRRVWTTAGVSTRQDFEVARNETLTLGASIAGHERFDVLDATGAVLKSVTPEQTYQTKAQRYARRLLLWSFLWLPAYALTWPALTSSAIGGFIALFAVTVATPWYLSRAIIDFCWWSGHGFRNETSARMFVATGLWVIDVAPLVLLQMLLLK